MPGLEGTGHPEPANKALELLISSEQRYYGTDMPCIFLIEIIIQKHHL